MKKYRVGGAITISVYVDVDAANEQEALRKAAEAPIQSLCHQCANGEDGCWSTGGELDGDVEVSGATEVAPRRRR